MTTLTKEQFFSKLRELYLFMNDQSDAEIKADWTRPSLAGGAGCQHIDRMIYQMFKTGVITEHEYELWLVQEYIK